MKFLTASLQEVVSKLSEDQKEKVDIIVWIVNTNETNKEKTKEKLFRFIEKRKPGNCIHFILRCIEHATKIRPKERESLLFLLTSVFNNFHLNFEITKNYYNLSNMLNVRNIIPYEGADIHVFDFADEETVGRAIFEDDIDLLQRIIAVHSNEGKEQIFQINHFFPKNSYLERSNANRIEIAALFGSIKCFKYLMIIGDEINEDACKFAVSGGNNEIIHLCEQKGLQFEDCLLFSSMFHRFEIFEWLNMHFKYVEIPLVDLIRYYNEPLFYLYSMSGLDIEAKDDDGLAPINIASKNGHLEVVKYLYETCHANIETKDNGRYTPIKNATINGHLDIVQYLYETCCAEVDDIVIMYAKTDEIKEYFNLIFAGKPSDFISDIHKASEKGKLTSVQFLIEKYHTKFETNNNKGHTPINIASSNGHLDIVKYLMKHVMQK